jgi:hypothetical protein
MNTSGSGRRRGRFFSPGLVFLLVFRRSSQRRFATVVTGPVDPYDGANKGAIYSLICVLNDSSNQFIAPQPSPLVYIGAWIRRLQGPTSA